MTLPGKAWILIALSFPAAAQEAPPPAAHARDVTATQARPAPGGDPAVLWMNPAAWTWVKSPREDTDIYLHQTGRAQARLIVSREGRTPEDQLAETLERVRKLDPDAHVVFEETRIVNGETMLCVQVVVSDEAEGEVVYYGYLYGSEERSVQLFTIARRAALAKLYPELTSLLNGLEVSKRAKSE